MNLSEIESAIQAKKNEIAEFELQKTNLLLDQRRKTLDWVLANRESLLEIIPHTRTSCKNTNNDYFHPEHGGAGCPHCVLKGLGKSDLDVEIFLELQITLNPL